jgi:hypothetical protein
MRRRLLPGLLALIVLPPVFAADDPPPGKELFPLASNARWTYRIQGQDDKLVIVVSPQLDKLGESRAYRLEGRLRDRLIATEQLTVRKDGVYRHRHDGMDIEPPLLICKFPATKGERWHIDYKIGDKKAAIDYSCEFEEVTVPAGTYKAVAVHAAVVEGGGLKTTCWYAPKVGLVKQVVEDGEGKIVLELEKFDRVTLKKP